MDSEFNQIEVITNLFTFNKNKLRVLLIKRDYEPFKGYWMLPSRLLMTDETVLECAKTKIKNVIGYDDIELKQCNVFSDIDRNPNNRIIADSLIGAIDIETLFKNRINSSYEIAWFPVYDLPKMVYDHNSIVVDAVNHLKLYLEDTSFLKSILPLEFTIPEFQKLNEEILKCSLDRRNFRKKVIDKLDRAGIKNIGKNGRPAELYRFRGDIYE